MRTFALVLLGCIFWLLPLAAAAARLMKYGFYEEGYGYDFDLVLLLGIPSLLIALTLALSWFAQRGRLASTAVVTCSATSFVAALYWLAIWGRGV